MEKVFQNSLFGYSKKSVIEYVAEMNEDFSRKLLEKDLENKKITQELRTQIEELKRENEELQAGRKDVAGALIDAKAFAGELMARAEADDKALHEKSRAYHQAEMERLQAISDHVVTLREALCAALRGMDEELARYEHRCQSAEEELRRETPVDAALTEANSGDGAEQD